MQQSYQKKPQPKIGGERQLQKMSFGAAPATQQSLDDLPADGKFNQFAGKTSTYQEELYTSKLDQHKITDQQRRDGMALEKELTTS